MTKLKELQEKLQPTPETKLRTILEAMDIKAMAVEEDHSLTRQDLARLIGLAYKDVNLTYRLAKLLVDLNRQ